MPSALADNPMRPEDWSDLTWEERDRRAWEAVSHWQDYTDQNVVRDGLDYALLTRWFLWDKVGRAVRRMTDAEDYELELKLLGWDGSPDRSLPPKNAPRKRPLARRVKGRVTSLVKGDEKRSDIPSGNRILYVPQPNARIEQACQSVMKNSGISLFAGEGSVQLPNVATVPASLRTRRPDESWPDKLSQSVAEGLRHFGIVLHELDIEKFSEQIRIQTRHIRRAEAELRWVRPDALLLHADNHPRPINYVLLCRNLGIPTIMLQHGLDCEHYYLDEAYASHIAVWGAERKTRYESNSAWQPKRIEVTGNPEFDNRSLPDNLDTRGDYWLWVSRPHSPDKCYAPSRSVAEGMHILDVLIETLNKYPEQKLIIKPHPYDTIEDFRDCIARREIAERVRVEESPLENWLAGASLVITEDSTAGLEAMFLGKPLIHTHFAPTLPTMPFGENGSALPAYTPEQLKAALDEAVQLTPEAQTTMLAAQRKTLQDFAGPCDGCASDRIRDFILATLENGA